MANTKQTRDLTSLRNLNYSPKKNPLLNTQQEPIRTKKGLVATKMSNRLVDPVTGEQHSHSLIHNVKEVDEQHFVKVFAEGVKKAFELNRTEARVFQKVLEMYETESMTGGYADSVSLMWFDGGLNGDAIGLSERTFKRGLRRLLEKGFISPKMPNVYWVNPSLFFKGDRVAFVTEYRRKTTVELLSDEEQDRMKLEENGQIRIDE